MEYKEFKQQFEALFTALQDSYSDGEISAFDYYKSMKYANALIEPNLSGAEFEAKKRLEIMYTKDELNQIGVEIREGRRMYDFKLITYTPYLEAKQKAEDAKKEVSSIEKLLIANISANEKMALHSDDGELLPTPVVTYSKPSVIIKNFE